MTVDFVISNFLKLINHGAGVAIDLNTSIYGQDQEGEADIHEIIWMEENAWKYGFYPLLLPSKTIISKNRPGLKVNNYKEAWHWNYIK